MNRKLMVTLGLAFFLLPLVLVQGVQAQNGNLAGTVVDIETGNPLLSVIVEVSGGGGTSQTAQTTSNGRFSFSLPAGNYSVILTGIGYAPMRVDGVGVTAGATSDDTYQMSSRSFLLNPVVITASRRQEKTLDAPASVAVVSAETIETSVAATPVEHVRTLPGVDMVQTGLTQSNVVARGFNNVFSGALLTIVDNRYAHVPSLRLNAHNMVPTNDLDIERIEVSLGPGAALYGPNASNGVLHMITKSPIDHPGTSFSLGGGERSVFLGSFRHATAVNDRFGFKVSGQYMQGDDWEHTDVTEAAARAQALMVDPNTRIGLRDFNAERWSGEARFDYRGDDGSELILSGGLNNLGSSVELTGIGAGQIKDWQYKYLQARYLRGRFFAQAFVNGSDAGESFILNVGDSIVDRSRMYAVQIQHGFDTGDRQSFTYGIDWQKTDPRTNGTVTGRNEADDTINEIGVYVHSETELSSMIDLVTAIRVDDHNRLDDLNFSPRAALVVHPDDNNTVRFTFNRSFDTPTTNNLFLDRLAGVVPLPDGTSFPVRVLGVPENGFSFPTCAGGFQSLCMRTPSAPTVELPADATLAWDALIAAFAPASLAPLLPNPGTAVNTILRRFSQEGAAAGDPFPLDQLGPGAISPIEPTISNTFEVGYKGVIGNRVVLAADAYATHTEDFIGPLRVETPTVFLDPATTAAYVSSQLAPLVGAGLVTQAEVQALIAGLASVPIGTVSPTENPNQDLLLTYRNFGNINLWGADLSLQVLATDQLTLKGTFSFVNDDCFDGNDDGVEDCAGTGDIALNAPKIKGSVSARWNDARSGVTLDGRVRFTDSFPMNSGIFVGTVESYAVVDISASYKVPWAPGVRLSVTASNLFDNLHNEFVGAPALGRLVLGRINYSF